MRLSREYPKDMNKNSRTKIEKYKSSNRIFIHCKKQY